MADGDKDASVQTEKRLFLDKEALIKALEARCQELRTVRDEKRQQRIMLANTRDEATQQIETLDREIAGAEGHGAEAEMWLAQVRNAQPLQPSQQNDVS